MKAPTRECVGICGECGRYRPVLSTIPDSDLLAELQRPERARLVCKAMEHVIDAGLDEQVPTQDQRGLHLSDAELVAELKRREAERVTGLIAEAKARAAATARHYNADHDQRAEDERIYQQGIGELLRGKR